MLYSEAQGEGGSVAEKFILWFDEIGVEHNDLVGKKCANLGEMTRAGLRVPPGFALTVAAYEDFLNKTGAIEEMRQYLSTFSADPEDYAKYEQATGVLRRIVEEKTMPKDMEDAIALSYDALCERTGIADVAVATRSAGPVSHPGQYETFLNVRGKADLMKNIIKVWASTFNTRSLIWRAREGLPLEFDPIGVAVLQMVNAKAAGVMFTLNPVNGDLSKITIGANWGLGESVVSGEVDTDEWMVDKVTFEIITRKVASKAVAHVVDAETGQVMVVAVPAERQCTPCLSDEEVLELARIGKGIEQHYGRAQDIEWAIDKDLPFPQNIFMLQTRPETVWSEQEAKPVLDASKSTVDYVIDLMMAGLKITGEKRWGSGE
jgi:pyruvate,water dikinase